MTMKNGLSWKNVRLR
jgi:hypothetical protein